MQINVVIPVQMRIVEYEQPRRVGSVLREDDMTCRYKSSTTYASKSGRTCALPDTRKSVKVCLFSGYLTELVIR